MKNFNLLRKSERKSVGTTLALTVGSPSFDRRHSALKHLAFMLLFLLGSLNVWGGDASVGDVLWGEDFGHYAANDVPSTKGTGTGTTVYGGATITYSNGSNVKAYSGNGQTYAGGSGAELYIKKGSSWTISGIPTGGATEMTLTYKSNNTNSSVATTDSPLGISISGSSKNYTITNTNGANSLTLVFSAASGNTRLDDIQLVVKTAAAGGCDKKVNISKGTPANGDFTLSMSGAQATCDGDVQVVVTPTPEEHYKVTGVSAPNSSNISGPDGDGTYTVTYTQNTNADSEISVTFALKDKYTVTWNNHGLTSTSQVYEGEKPVFPETPTSCDATSTTFIGWATENWTGKLADLAGKTVYTSAAEMPAVTGPVEYFAVFAKVAGESGWIETAIGDLGASDVFVFSDGSYALNNDGGTSDAPTANAITVSDGKITSDVANNLKWNISGNATDGYTFYPNGSTTTWLYCSTTKASSSNNNMRVGTGDRKVFEINASGYLVTKDTYTARYLSRYDDSGTPQDFRGYTSTGSAILPKFYKYSAGSASDYMTTCAAEGTCEAPSFSPAAGTFDEAQDITLQTSTPSAHIYYTLDGTDPDNGSAEYSTPIHITQNTTIKAITYADGLTKSSISEGVFNIRCAQPTFSLEEGEYTTAQNVTISAAGAEHIYYTLNGNDPVPGEEGTSEYTAAISINTTGSHTIKAIAVKAGYANSNVASATYVMDLPYANIAAFITAAPATAKSLTLNNAIITGVDGTTLYVQDETAGIMIYGLASLPDNAAPNHSISGTIKGAYKLFKNQHELVKPDKTTPIDMSGVTISAGEVARPAINEYTSLSAAYAAKPMMLVTLKGVNYDGTQYEFSGNKIYNTFGALTDKTMPETTVDCDITGVVINYNGTLELLPVFATDIVADADAAAPVFTPAGGATEGEAVQVDLNSYVSIAPADANHSVDITSAQITTTEPVSVTAVSSRDFYRNTSVTKWYYGNSASASYDINGQGSTPQGTIVAKVNDEIAASAKENDEVHVFITPEEHFALNTITVNGNVPTTESAGTEYSFTMPGEAVTIVVTWTEDEKATLTFAKGDADGEEAAPENIVDYIGETVQLPANPFTYTGHKFVGWSCDGGTTKLAAGANYTLVDDKEFVAQWDEIPTFNNSGYEWQLVTSDDQLVAGKYYVIASTAKGKVMSNTISNSIASEIAATFTDGVIAYNAFGSSQSADVAGVAVLQLGGEADAWKLTEVVENDALLGATAVKKIAWGSGTTTWSISFANNNATIQNGTSAYGRFLHNVQNTRFTTYTSDPAANMLLPQLYVWAEKVYKLRYDANGGENAPAAQAADGEGKATVTDVKPTYTDHIFNGWNTLVGGNGEAKAAGDVIDLSEGDVTLYAQWREPATVTISYAANGGEGTMDADENQTEGSTYTIKTNTFERNGYLFAGWKAYDANDVELTITNGKFTVPATNVTVKAQWGAWTATDFVLVTDKALLKDGDKVYIVAAEYERAMGTQNTNYRNEVAIQKAGSSIKVMEGAEPVEFTVGKDGDNFTFKDGVGYLYAAGTATSKENYMNTKPDADAACNWTITIDENGTEIKSVENDKTPFMQYNLGLTRFSCYYTSSQQAVQLYKKENAEPVYETVRSGLEVNRYYTVCLPKKVTAIKGASFWTLNSKSQDGAIAYLEEETNNLPFDAGKPFIIQATAAQLEVVYEGAATEEAGINGALYGTLVYMNATALDAAGEDIYMLFSNELRPVGVNNHLDANRAYVRLSELHAVDEAPQSAPGRRVRAMPMQPQVATGFEAAEANEAPRKVLINGELFILRGEKMYDAKGQLVK